MTYVPTEPEPVVEYHLIEPHHPPVIIIQPPEPPVYQELRSE